MGQGCGAGLWGRAVGQGCGAGLWGRAVGQGQGLGRRRGYGAGSGSLRSPYGPFSCTPQHVRLCGILRRGSAGPGEERHNPLHPREDEAQAQQNLLRFPGAEEVCALTG